MGAMVCPNTVVGPACTEAAVVVVNVPKSMGLSAARSRHNNEFITIQPLGGMLLRPCGAAAVAVSWLWIIDQTHQQNLI